MPRPTCRARRLLAVGVTIALLGIILGAKWATFGNYGTDVPRLDQWDAEGMHALVPWFENRLLLPNLLELHNEHRVVLTKLQSLALVLVSGQWDARLQCVVNALLHAALAAGFWVLAQRWTARPWHPPLFLLIAALFGLPIAWENILGGFHSQQYWLLGLSCTALVLLPFARPWTPGWWLGVIAAVVALGAMASGFLAAAVVAVVVGFRWWKGQTPRRDAMPAILIALGVILIGWLSYEAYPFHADLKAQTARDFFLSIGRSLAWPLYEAEWAGALLWLPWAIITWRVLRSANSPNARGDQTLAALGGWVLLQVVATAYARGAGGNHPATRYMDTLGVGVLINAIAIARLLSPALAASASVDGGARGFHCGRLILQMAACGWAIAVATGLANTTAVHIRQSLPDERKFSHLAEINLREYLLTDDPANLDLNEIPYPSAIGLMERLAFPSLRRLMPASVRPPLSLRPATTNNFIENRIGPPPALESHRGLPPATPPLGSLKTFGSFGKEGVAATGEWTSAPVTSRAGGWLKFETAGHIGEHGITLELRDAASNELFVSVRPSRVPGNSWRSAYVPAPDRPFVVVARDADAARWLAFSEPVEMSQLSFLAWQATRHGLLICSLSFAAAIALGVVGLVDARLQRDLAAGIRANAWRARIREWMTPPPEIEPARRPRSWGEWVLYVVATIVLGLVNVIPPAPMISGLDPSWNLVLLEAQRQGWQFGPEVAFTYGPLGYFFSVFCSGPPPLPKLLWEFAGKFALAATLVALTANLPRWRQIAAWGLMVVGAVLFGESAMLMAIAIIGTRWLLPARTSPWLVALGLGWLAIFAAIKFTMLVAAAAIVVIAVVAHGARARIGRAAAIGAGAILGFGLLWLATGQQLRNLPAYLRYSWEVADGYTWAMQIDALPTLVWVLGIATWVAGASFALRVWREARDRVFGAAAVLMTLVVWFLVWKHGFTRADFHAVGFFLGASLLALTVPPLLLPGTRTGWINLCPVLGCFGIILTEPQSIAWVRDGAWARLRHNPDHVLSPGEWRKGYDEADRQARAAVARPDLASAIGAGTVDILGYDQVMVMANNLPYRPRPIFQSYSAYTLALLDHNLRFFQSARAPEFIIAKAETIDGRYLAQEDSLLLPELRRRYDVLWATEELALLRRKSAQPEAPAPRPRSAFSRRVRLGEEVRLPAERNFALWLQARIEPSIWGHLLAFVGQPAGLSIILTDDEGHEHRCRLVPRIAAAGFVVQPMLQNQAHLNALLRGYAQGWARSFRIETLPGSGVFWKDPMVEISVLPDQPIEPAEPMQVFVDQGYINQRPDSVRSVAAPEHLRVGDRYALQLHAPGEIVVKRPPGTARLTGWFGLRGPGSEPNPGDGVEFSVAVRHDNDNEEVIWRRHLEPAKVAGDDGPQSFAVELPPGDYRLILRTDIGPNGRGEWDWSYWSGLRFLP